MYFDDCYYSQDCSKSYDFDHSWNRYDCSFVSVVIELEVRNLKLLFGCCRRCPDKSGLIFSIFIYSTNKSSALPLQGFFPTIGYLANTDSLQMLLAKFQLVLRQLRLLCLFPLILLIPSWLVCRLHRLHLYNFLFLYLLTCQAF